MITVPEIIMALFSEKGVTPERISKAKGAAKRSNVEWSQVLASMSPEQRAMVEG